MSKAVQEQALSVLERYRGQTLDTRGLQGLVDRLQLVFMEQGIGVRKALAFSMETVLRSASTYNIKAPLEGKG